VKRPISKENITPLKESEATDDKPVEPSVVLRASNDTPHPSEPTDTESSNLLKSAEPSQTLPPTADSLQVAAQRYPWLYMSSTLDACFAEAEKTASVCLTSNLETSNFDLLFTERARRPRKESH
jgi:hypothetical protein